MDKKLVLSIARNARRILEIACAEDPAARRNAQVVSDINLGAQVVNEIAGHVPHHRDLLREAISKIPEATFGDLKASLKAGQDELVWQTDDGLFYRDGADVGDGYRNGNMHALLIGPKDSPFFSDDVLFGLFLLAPNTLYRDHRHAAPEIYVPLTGPQGWRFDQGPWENHEAGRAIFNAPSVVHATRVYETPFLALFLWSRDIGSPCEVISANDWANVEAQLSQ